jgi:hypothetical protein
MKSWKVQKFFGDVVYDLRSRGLLPVAILLVVAILAVPILISRGGGADGGAPAAVSEQSAAELAPENQAAVLAYNPGLRDYKERLSEAASKDPFIQQHVQSGSDSGSGGGSTGVAAAASTTTGSGSGGGSGGSSSSGEIRYYYYETDLAVGEAGGKLKRINKVAPFTYLPSQKAPATLFLGNTKDGNVLGAIFSVANNVAGVEGGTCLPAPDDCQMLEMKAGETADVTYAVDNKVYRIKVLRVDFVVSHKPPKGFSG